MSKIALALKINVSAMDPARLFNGQKGQYLDCTVFVDLDQLDQYGNSGMITQDVSKEEKQQGIKGNILGNAKIFWTDTGRMPQPQQQGSYNNQPPQQGGYQAPQQQGGFQQQAPPQQQASQQGGYQQQPPMQQQPPQQQGGFQQQAPLQQHPQQQGGYEWNDNGQ
jgi:hypothetical protein